MKSEDIKRLEDCGLDYNVIICCLILYRFIYVVVCYVLYNNMSSIWGDAPGRKSPPPGFPAGGEEAYGGGVRTGDADFSARPSPSTALRARPWSK